jgi:hypothetical protein
MKAHGALQHISGGVDSPVDVADHATPKMHAKDAIARFASLLGCYRVSAALHARLLEPMSKRNTNAEVVRKVLDEESGGACSSRCYYRV